MRKLGVVEAAAEIRNDVFGSPGMNPEEIHQVRFVQGVCGQLGLDATPENMHKVSVTLHKHDIGLHVGHEYPKYAIRAHDRAQKIVHDEQEASAWENETPPEPVAPLGPIIEKPVQGHGLDLRDQIPARDVSTTSGNAMPQTAEVHAHAETVDDEVHVEGHDDHDVHTEEVHTEPPATSRRKRPQ